MKNILFRHILFAFFLFFAFELKSQDCRNAIEINVPFHEAAAPTGYGKKMEMGRNDFRSLYYFEVEHHTVWYVFTVKQNCTLTFEITPENIADDYDFVLFRCNRLEDYCKAIDQKKIKPIRSIISRNDRQIGSRTGLVADSRKPEFVHSGPGESFGSGVEAKKDDFFVLVVDNVYKNGKGHKITFSACLEEPEKIEPPQTDTLKTEIVKLDSPKVDLEKTFTDTLAKISPDTISEEKVELEKIEKEMLENKVFTLDKVYFHGNSAFVKTESVAQLKALLTVMQNNPKLSIRLHSHTNGKSKGTYTLPKTKTSTIVAPNAAWTFYPGNARILQSSSDLLSEERALSIRNFLLTGGIDEKRIKMKSWGDKKMIHEEWSAQAHLNMRVEVEVLEK